MTVIEETLIELHANYGYTQGCIERILNLKAKSLSIENPAPELIALMKVIRTYPWLLKVADNNYNEFEAKRILGHVAVDLIVNKQANENRLNSLDLKSSP